MTKQAFFAWFFILAFAVLLLTLIFQCSAKAQGKERWDKKTLTDRPTLSKVVASTVAIQNSLRRPIGNWLKMPRQRSEDSVYKISGILVESGIEADNDYHLVISDGKCRMICEIPDPAVCSGNPNRGAWAAARAAVDAKFGKPTHSVKPVKKPLRVTITGVGFWDKPDHGEGHAVNGREIHPVLKFE